jgi:hypothetical protein
MPHRSTGKAVSCSPDLTPQPAWGMTLSLEDLAASGTTPEGHELNQLARQSITHKPLDTIWAASTALSMSIWRQQAQYNLGIFQADFGEDRQAVEALPRAVSPSAPSSAPQAGPYRLGFALTNHPGSLTALQPLLLRSATTGVFLKIGQFGNFGTPIIKTT